MKEHKNLLISIAILHVIIIAFVIFFYCTIDRKLSSIKDNQLEQVKSVHKEELKSEDIDSLRDHGDRLWRVIESQRDLRKSELRLCRSMIDVTLWLVVSEVCIILGYYLSKKIKRKREQGERNGNDQNKYGRYQT